MTNPKTDADAPEATANPAADSEAAGVTTKPSGLRNPPGAVRGLGSVTLIVQALVLLLALAPMIKFGGAHRHGAFVLCLVLAVASIVFVGLLKARWVWWAAAGIPAAMVVGGLALNLGLLAVGVIFGLTWIYVLYVRSSILRT
jgi:hypothetical protein